MSQQQPVEPRVVIEASRDLARYSRNLMKPALDRKYRSIVLTTEAQKAYRLELEQRMDLVMDCFNTGAAMMLNLLHGDQTPEPWADDYDHQGRLHELLGRYGLLATATAHPETLPLSSQDQPTAKDVS